MKYIKNVQEEISKIVKDIFEVEISVKDLPINETRKEFEGDYTLVVFPLVKILKKNPAEIAETIGTQLVERVDFIDSYNVIKGFLNFGFTHEFWLGIFEELSANGATFEESDDKIMIEFSSPNTNKPLHLGHVRNILLGWSASQILSRIGKKVIKTQIINDRGIAICKSMLAWKKFGEGKSPSDVSMKSDHYVGSFYVEFEKAFKAEYADWQQSEQGQQVFTDNAKSEQTADDFFKKYKNNYFNTYSQLGSEAKEMLLKWEDNDPEVRGLWQQMNQWVYDGFNETYKDLGVEFDSLYYESDTYTLGKSIIEEGLAKGVFYKKEDGSVWIDLTDDGLDHKLVLRSDGTSVYMTQDIGTANRRYLDTNANGMVYVVADEQDYHFKALFAILKKLGEPYASMLYHLNYGMVDLPTGRMKSREGTVVDADDLMKEVTLVAQKNAEERGELTDFTEEQKQGIYKKIGMAALKFFILKVNPRKRMIFNPEESVDMQGTTGPYVLYAHVRLDSILKKAEQMDLGNSYESYTELAATELNIIKLLQQYKAVLAQAGADYDPSVLAMYAYELAKASHKFIHDLRILNAESDHAKVFRLKLGKLITETLKDAFHLLGIEMPEKM